MTAPKPITNIVLLVHPFHSFKNSELHGTNFVVLKRNSSFIAGLWGLELKKAASQPETLVIIANTGEPIPIPKISNRFNRFIKFAQKTLGNRLFLTGHRLYSSDVLSHLKAHGMEFSKTELKGKSFGEYWKKCLHNQTEKLEAMLGGQKIKRVQRLSVTHILTKINQNTLGKQSEDMLKNAARKRARIKKYLSRRK